MKRLASCLFLCAMFSVSADPVWKQLGPEAPKLDAIEADHPWLPVYRLYAAALRTDRDAMVKEAQGLKAPGVFPLVAIEKKRLAELMGQGLEEARLTVARERDHQPLYALRRLDRLLEREAGFFEMAGDTEKQQVLIKARDLLRKNYLTHSRHIIERLFALDLAGKADEHKALLARVQASSLVRDRRYLQQQDVGGSKPERTLLEVWVDSELKALDEATNLPPLALPTPGSGYGMRQLTIDAKTKTPLGAMTQYAGSVDARLGSLRIRASRLDWDQVKNELSGSWVKLDGLPGTTNTVTAAECTIDMTKLQHRLSGVELDGTWYVQVTVDAQGRKGNRVTADQRFRQARTPTEKGQAITALQGAGIPPKALPAEARYLYALGLLAKQMQWAAPRNPHGPAPEEAFKVIEEERALQGGDRFVEAHRGSTNFYKQVSAVIKKDFRDAYRDLHGKPPPPGAAWFSWRIDDMQHGDVLEAIRLLKSIEKRPAQQKAQALLEVIERNNTVMTFDVPGALFKGHDGLLVMDACNTDLVRFRVYRVEKPEELAWVCRRIGKDFIFRDFGLQHGQGMLRQVEAVSYADELQRDQREEEEPHDPPDLVGRKALADWKLHVDQAKVLPPSQRGRHSGHHDEEDWEEGPDAGYFNDACSRHHRRLDYRYHKRNELSSWSLNRVVTIPAEALAEAGAYILIAEANGQEAFVPLLVDPLSLTLRRCRDGVFTLVSAPDGMQPVEGAQLLDTRGRSARSDPEGAAFLRSFAAGDRAIIAEHKGRYAIGGFGRVFEGIYQLAHRRDAVMRRHVLREARAERIMEAVGFVFEDRHVLAAYTDRPLYRPGQPVHFKMLVRRLAAEGEVQGGGFRDADFDRQRVLRLPEAGSVLRWEVINPRGRTVASGHGVCNDFGTLSGSFSLNEETRTGRYAMRVRLAGVDRVLPEVFQVQYYRRPNVDLQVAGLPDTLEADTDALQVNLTGRFFFGKPAALAPVRVRLMSEHSGRSLAEAKGRTDQQGEAALEIRIPEALRGKTLRVFSELTDAGGRTVSQVQVVTGKEEPPATTLLDTLPGFVRQGRSIQLAGSGTVRVKRGAETRSIETPAPLSLEQTGWHRISVGTQHRMLFVYRPGAEIQDIARGPWVNLAHFEQPDRQVAPGGIFRSRPVSALFEKQSFSVGDTLRLLLHLPWLEGKARLVFTIEGRSVVDYHVAEVDGSEGVMHLVEIPVKERYTPNAYVQARVIARVQDHQAREDVLPAREEVLQQLAEEDLHDPAWCRIDVQDPAARPGREKLRIQVTPDREHYAPGDEVQVDLQVSGLDGRPAEAELSLSAVDASLFAFGPGRESQLAALFTSDRRSRAYRDKAWRSSLGAWWQLEGGAIQVEALQEMQKQMAESLAMAREDARQAVVAPVIAGEMPLALTEVPLREDFRETAAWLPHLVTDAAGRASARFKLPDSLTRYRLTTVGITRDSRIGTDQGTEITASKPLSVQLYLPRFAVENDRLLARGMIHNQGKEALSVEIDWAIEGAEADQVEAAPLDIGAGETIQVERWIDKARIGALSVSLTVRSGKWNDAVRRGLSVQGLGRRRTVQLKGVFKGEHRIDWPAGFSPERIQASVVGRQPIAVAQALEGLHQLVDYPYGCVEQTMSRFLPSVLVQRASRRWDIELPPEVEDKLPAVMERGLERLYNHQKKDGSWGWWPGGQRDDRMTLYVMYGLLQCKSAGVAVDAGVLDRGLDRITRHLEDERFSVEGMAQAWSLLVTAGRADADGLGAFVEGVLNSRSHARVFARLALACREFGLEELALRCYGRVQTWEPEGSDELALKLKCQLLFGEPLPRFFPTAQALTDLRRGLSWGSTWQTAKAIDALSHAMPFVPPPPPETNATDRVEILFGEEALLSKAYHPRKTNRYRLDHRLTTDPARPLSLRSNGAARFTWSLTAEGLQAFEDMEPIGTELEMIRRYERKDYPAGTVFPVELELDVSRGKEYVLIEDRIPAGCEFAGEWLEGDLADAVSQAEFRDDRISLFLDRLPVGRHKLVYYLRAETEGRFQVLPGVVYPMYEDEVRGETGADVLDVTRGP